MTPQGPPERSGTSLPCVEWEDQLPLPRGIFCVSTPVGRASVTSEVLPRGERWRGYLRSRVRDKCNYLSLHPTSVWSCTQNIHMTCGFHCHHGSQKPPLMVALRHWVSRDTWEENGGFSTELSLPWDLVAGKEGLQHPTTSFAIQLKKKGIILDFSFIQHFTQL